MKLNELHKDSFKPELAETLQNLMHGHGADAFAASLSQAFFWASDDTEDFDDKRLTQLYRHLANEFIRVLEETPEFDNESYEDAEGMR